MRKINFKSLLGVLFFCSLNSFRVSAQSTPDPGLPGPYAVSVGYYDLGDLAYKPPTYPDSVEVRGSVHYPTDLSAGPFPVLFFLHGRHGTCFKTSNPSITDQTWPCPSGYESITSFEGYDYLAEQMASHGYIVISISCNAINATDNGVFDYGMQGRAELLEHHMDLWNTYNTIGGAPFDTLFIGKLDMTNIGTMGHSRGGEGVVRNALYNRTLGSPYGIKAVLSLAPVDFLGEVLNGIALMNIAPYCDGDVSDLQGVHYFDNARYPGTDDNTPKHCVLFLGANHNFFNTVWTPGEYIAGTADDWYYTGDNSDPQCGTSSPTNKRLTPDREQASLITYASAFFRYYIGHETQFAPILDVEDIIPPASSTLDSSEVFVSYQAPDSLRLDINRVTAPDNDLTNTLSGNVSQDGLTDFTICGDGVDESDCGISSYQEKVPHEGFGFLGLSQQGMRWSAISDWYENDIPAVHENFAFYKYIQFRATVNYSNSPSGQNLNFSIQLVDSAGNTNSRKVSDFSNALFFQPGTLNWDLPKAVFNTIKIPLSAFSGIDMSHITEVKFLFDQMPHGSVLISDLSLSGRHGILAGTPKTTFITTPVINAVVDDMLVFPNPAGNYININLGNNFENNSTIELYDIEGKLLYTLKNVQQQIIRIDLSRFADGAYILNITSGGSAGNYKIIKE